MLGQPIKLHHGRLRGRRSNFRVRVGRSHSGGYRVGRGRGPRLSSGTAQSDHARLHRKTRRALHRAGAAEDGRQRAVPNVSDQQPDVRDRHMQSTAGMRARHRHRSGTEARTNGAARHGRQDHHIFPVSRPGRGVRVEYRQLQWRFRTRPVRAGPEGRRLRTVSHARGARPPLRRPVDTREQLSRLYFRYGRLSGRQRPFATPRQRMQRTTVIRCNNIIT